MFIAFRAVSSWPRVVHFINNLRFIEPRPLSSRPRIVHVNHNPELFIVSRGLSSRSKVIYVIHSLELFIVSKSMSSQPKVIHVNHNPEVYVASRGGRFNFPCQICPDPLIGYFISRYLTTGWERRTFQLPQSDMSRSFDSTYPESIRSCQIRFPGQLGSSNTRDLPDPFPPIIKKQTLIILTTKSPFFTVQRNFYWSIPIFSTDILRYFALDIWCLNPQTLLVTHLS